MATLGITRRSAKYSPGIQIPFNDLSRQNATLGSELQSVIARVVQRGQFVLGDEVTTFESRFAAYCGTRFCIGMGNGSDALRIALQACDVRPGSRVLTVANAGGYATEGILALKAVPVFADVCPAKGLIDITRLDDLFALDLSAIVVTHLYGQLVPMSGILRSASAAGVAVIEDAAHAHGARINGISSGTLGACGCFSFYPTKNLGASGDGGAITTNDPELEAKVRRLHHHGWEKPYHVVEKEGSNSKLDEMQAAILNVKLARLEEWNERRRAIARRYTNALEPAGFVSSPRGCDEQDSVHLFTVRVDNREVVRARLRANGISTAIHYPIPDYLQEAYRNEPWARIRLPQTEAHCREVLSLPCFPELTAHEVDYVIDQFLRAAKC